MSCEKDDDNHQVLNDQEEDQRDDHKNKRTTATANRPAMQIYRPPGLRSDPASSAPSGSAHEKPNSSAGSKLNQGRNEENNNKRERSEADSTSSRASSRASGEDPQPQAQLFRTDSSLSADSASQKSVKTKKPNTLPVHVVRKEVKKRSMTEKEIEDAIIGLRSLNLTSHNAQIEQWIAGAFCDEQLAESIGSTLSRHAIEGGGGREVAKLCALFKDSPSVNSFIMGVMNALSQYFDCREGIRTEHFRMWISFIKFLTDFYSSLGAVSPDDLSDVVFQVFNHLLRPPVLESLKIEELECLISALLTIGYDLERDCPDQLALLKDLIRDAFVDATEPWARKMILLLLELGASNWKLPAEANEYYFQQATN